MKRLSGKTAIITGSVRGIGKGIAEKFSESGANIVIVDILQEEIDKTVSQLKVSNPNVIGIKCDITQENDVENLVEKTMGQFQSIDILVNNAGITRDKLLIRMTLADWEDVIKVNLTGTFLCTQKVSKIMMKQRKGKILNIASVVGIMGNAGQSNYSASKGGIIAFTKSVAKELAPRNINVNAIAPGFIKTEMTDRLPDEVKENYLKSIPFRNFGDTQDVAELALFLCSEESDYITGQTIVIDGGMI
ncbi:MAG: 3-oxoacyl-[acyl-carrier-protein] reductase [Candidatus Cloacimonetes bacterium]|nr:3-oxoacyl-[acyl-carrier-protein] reductase [Candidatus Cloacimonadota bacterium]MBL7085710.1 3-oxoacyl-[acyl-carrier-protein] reductase [Candidatus Cloacimonadota bacterium]